MTTESLPTVLFVDDEQQARKYFCKGLQDDFTVLTAASVETACDILAHPPHTISVLVTDQRMPGGNGVKLLAHVREQYPRIVCLLTTAYSDLQDTVDSVNRGDIFRYIPKPWSWPALKEDLYQAVALFQLRQERDNLLQEKLAARQRLVRSNRLRDLLIVSEAIPGLRFSRYATQQCLLFQGSATLPAQPATTATDRFALWEGEAFELERMCRIGAQLQTTIVGHQPDDRFADTVVANELLQLCGQFAKVQDIALTIATATGSSMAMQMNRHLITATVSLLLRLATGHQSADELTVTLTDHTLPKEATKQAQEATVPAIKMVLTVLLTDSQQWLASLRGDTLLQADYPEQAVALLACYLMVYHHGGTLTMESADKDQAIDIILTLPQNPLHRVYPLLDTTAATANLFMHLL